MAAIETLKSSDYIFCPRTESGSIAAGLVKRYVQKDIEFIDFPMGKDIKIDVSRILKSLLENKNVSFVSIGDPLFYSTFLYIMDVAKKYEIEIKVFPTITSFSLAASKINLPIALKDEGISVVPGTNLKLLEKAVNIFDNIVVIKPNRNFLKIVDILKDKGFKIYIFENLGFENERVFVEDIPESIGYLSIIIAKRGIK
ncbi:MAG: precorrin-2/cobalt-factor-2 C20-methyltransferase [Thermosipho sp. (in: thermotogales)]|nr:precorrin-2/cobalt-factor-2 C20-methyltransferase [Thermosipho sp. (in: thermotogales)]MDK2900463.1 precorrin-2/cobalt-factor-2 C20-methyltransferase [Thermosipho sp. (in: thermotogales)]